MPLVAAATSDMSIPSGKTNTQVTAHAILLFVLPSQLDCCHGYCPFLQVALYPERHIQASATTQDPLIWKGGLLAIGIYSDSLHVQGLFFHRLPWRLLFALDL